MLTLQAPKKDRVIETVQVLDKMNRINGISYKKS